jgi:hypothetical protein
MQNVIGDFVSIWAKFCTGKFKGLEQELNNANKETGTFIWFSIS